MQDELGWEVVNCYGEWEGGKSALGRDGKREMVLTGRLKPALQRLNPEVCKDLLAKLKTEKLLLAWRTKRTTRAAVRVEIEKMLDSGLPETYTTDLFEQKRGMLFQHVLEKYPESGESVYEAAG